MYISVGSDHRGFEVKSSLIQFLDEMGHETTDEGTHSGDSVDYPDVARQVGKKVSAGEAERGLLICGSGVGMAIAANKLPGVRAAAIQDESTAEMARKHNDLNVLCLSADTTSHPDMQRIVRRWLETEFEGGRHRRRIEKIRDLETGD